MTKQTQRNQQANFLSLYEQKLQAAQAAQLDRETQTSLSAWAKQTGRASFQTRNLNSDFIANL